MAPVLRAVRTPPRPCRRDCIKRTLDAKGLPFLGELSLQNCKDLALLIQCEQGAMYQLASRLPCF